MGKSTQPKPFLIRHWWTPTVRGASCIYMHPLQLWCTWYPSGLLGFTSKVLCEVYHSHTQVQSLVKTKYLPVQMQDVSMDTVCLKHMTSGHELSCTLRPQFCYVQCTILVQFWNEPELIITCSNSSTYQYCTILVRTRID